MAETAPSRQGVFGRSLGRLASAMTRMQNKVYSPPSNNIANVSESDWPNPLQPVQPIGPQGSQPLAWPFWEGQNLTYTPRPDSLYTAAELRQLATYPLMRILIEQVKNDITSVKWSIQAKKKPGESNNDRIKRQAQDPKIKQLNDFFSYPDGETNWSTWIRPFLDDLLVIDAPCIFMERTFADKIVGLRVVPGHNIARYIDDNGWTPKDPSPAYAQLWEGIPRVNLTTKQLVYRPYNIVHGNTASSYLYGQSPVQSMATEIQVGIERLQSVLAYYTEGAVPGLIHVVPAGIIPDKVTENVQAMNALLSGNLGQRRKWNVTQGYMPVEGTRADQIIETKDPVLADVFDDLHIRKLAYGIGASAQRLLKAMNRASAQAGQDAAEEEGTLPWLMYVKNTHDYIIQMQMGFTEYEWIPDTNREPDPKTQMETITGYIKAGTMTENEGRKRIDLDPSDSPEADGLMVITATGAVPLEGAIERTETATANATVVANKPPPTPVVHPTAAGAAKLVRRDERADDFYLRRY